MNRAGSYKNHLSGDAAYKSFMPAPLPPDPGLDIDAEMLSLLIKANNQTAVLKFLSPDIPDIDLFISMYVRKEALLSSQIEGTQATLEDILDPAADISANRHVADVINYIKAMDFAVKRLQQLPLCSRLLKETHAVLMQGVRGEEKYPGEFRRSQNWIGAQGSTLKTARYIPPSPEDMDEAMSSLEKYMNSDDLTDPLIKAGLIHYQFETIHPFLDGNGRIGRLLVILYMIEKKVLNTPSLYISCFLKENRTEYYDRLSEVRNKNNYEQWIKFFLKAVYESALDASDTINRLTSLHKKNLELIKSMGRSAKNGLRLFAYIEANPIIDIKKTAAALDVSFNTVSKAVNNLCDAGILTAAGTAGRNRLFIYGAYLDLLRSGT